MAVSTLSSWLLTGDNFCVPSPEILIVVLAEWSTRPSNDAGGTVGEVADGQVGLVRYVTRLILALNLEKLI
jgi:hypothetical protein